jgi:hypothetical protein
MGPCRGRDRSMKVAYARGGNTPCPVRSNLSSRRRDVVDAEKLVIGAGRRRGDAERHAGSGIVDGDADGGDGVVPAGSWPGPAQLLCPATDRRFHGDPGTPHRRTRSTVVAGRDGHRLAVDHDRRGFAVEAVAADQVEGEDRLVGAGGTSSVSSARPAGPHHQQARPGAALASAATPPVQRRSPAVKSFAGEDLGHELVNSSVIS